MSTTAYIVLKFDPDGAGAWVLVASDATYMAGSAEQAVRAAADEYGDGRYLAIPSRSWRPLDVTTERVPRRVVSDLVEVSRAEV